MKKWYLPWTWFTKATPDEAQADSPKPKDKRTLRERLTSGAVGDPSYVAGIDARYIYTPPVPKPKKGEEPQTPGKTLYFQQLSRISDEKCSICQKDRASMSVSGHKCCGSEKCKAAVYDKVFSSAPADASTDSGAAVPAA